MAQPIRSAPIDLQTAETVISAKSGQTVVMAGLITSDKVLNLRRVPWLADIPLLGRLFEYEQSQDLRSELMIIMTPHIVESDEDYEWVKAMESERMSWCLADIVNIHGDVGFQGPNPLFCCDNLPVIYPHNNPVGLEVGPMPVDEGAPPPVYFNESEGEELFNVQPVVPSGLQAEPTPRPNESAGGPPPPPQWGASRYETHVMYGPPPAEPGVERLRRLVATELQRLPDTMQR